MRLSSRAVDARRPVGSPAERARDERVSQGLPERLEDLEVAGRLARIVATDGARGVQVVEQGSAA